MNRCQFIYADGSRCKEQTFASRLSPETITFKGVCPTEDREVIRSWHPAEAHYRFCHYHRQILKGEATPAFTPPYDHMANQLRKVRLHFEDQFLKKKERELNR